MNFDTEKGIFGIKNGCINMNWQEILTRKYESTDMNKRYL